jgi:hypothetical protein
LADSIDPTGGGGDRWWKLVAGGRKLCIAVCIAPKPSARVGDDLAALS